jgi:hypothetical protein
MGITRTTEDGVPLIEGREYEIIGEGARLHGLVPTQWPNTLHGWTEVLPVGALVIYTGFRMGWGSDSIQEHMWSSDESRQARAQYVNMTPSSGGLYDSRPKAGLIRLVE